MALQNTNPTETSAWQKLKTHFSSMQSNSLKEMFQNDTKRAEKFHIQWNDFLVDYSKNNITQETIDLLIAISQRSKFKRCNFKIFCW